MTPLQLIARFADLNVLVVGEAMLDRFLAGDVRRVCREAPVPIVALDRSYEVAGGAANTAVAAAALGARVTFVSAVGHDADGAALIDVLATAGVIADAVIRVPGRATLVKQRISGNGQLLLRIDRGSEANVDGVTERRLADAITAAWVAADAVIVSDYGYGIATPAIIDLIAGLQQRSPRVLVGDAKDLTRWARAGMTAAKPNYGEAVALAGLGAVGDHARIDQMLSARDMLSASIGADIVTVTLDRLGALVFEGAREPYRTFTQPAADSHASGAGDMFTATLALALAAGAHSAGAADLASAAATACMAQPGTSVCTAERLAEQVAGQSKLGQASVALDQVAAWRDAGKRIVFTNGCFDILHHGHITYLNRAKALGDVLIVGLNSDASVRALKGPARPINAEGDRAAVLAALSCVDLVMLFDDPTPAVLIEAIRPHLFVKGGDYTIDTLPEAALVKALGGEIKLLDFLKDRSTTGIIERIRAAYAPLEAAG